MDAVKKLESKHSSFYLPFRPLSSFPTLSLTTSFLAFLQWSTSPFTVPKTSFDSPESTRLDSSFKLLSRRLLPSQLELTLPLPSSLFSIGQFSWGVANRGASIRIPRHVAQQQKGSSRPPPLRDFALRPLLSLTSAIFLPLFLPLLSGYLEDRRPASNIDPYQVSRRSFAFSLPVFDAS